MKRKDGNTENDHGKAGGPRHGVSYGTHYRAEGALKRLAELDFDTIFCCLLGVVTGAKPALMQKIEFMEALRDRAYALHAQGLSDREIRRQLLGNESIMFYLSGGHYGLQNTIDSILSRGEI